MTATISPISPRRTTYVSVADTAKLVRAALKAAFPSITFSVRSKSYSGGASIDVGWVDGPTAKEVEAVRAPYVGSTFDAMIDLSSPVTATDAHGNRIHYGADHIFCNRRYSVEFAQRVADEVATCWGMAWITVTASSWDGSADWSAGNNTYPEGQSLDGYRRAYDLCDLIHQAISQRPYTPPEPPPTDDD